MKNVPYLIIISILFLSSLWSEEENSFILQSQKEGYEEYQKGTQYYLVGENNKAISHWQTSALKNNVLAQLRLLQDDLKNNSTNNAEFYKNLQKDNEVRIFLELKYQRNRQHKPLSFLKAVERLEKYCELKEPWILSIVGNEYLNKGVQSEQFQRGLKYITQAAELNYSPAMDRLGVLYWEGLGDIKQDANKAIEWFSKGNELGDDYCTLHLAQIYHRGIGEIFKSDILKAIPLYEKLVKKNDVDALINLGLIYEDGQEVAKDLVKAHSYFDKLLNARDPEIFTFLGSRYYYGREGLKDKEKGIFWYEQAAIYGGLQEKHKLATFYFTDGDVKDYQKARVIFEDLVKKHPLKSNRLMILVHLRLGDIYLQGLGTNKDLSKAIQHFSVVDFTSEALEKLIHIYYDGKEIARDDKIVQQYLDKLFDPSRPQGYNPASYYHIYGEIKERQNNKKGMLDFYRLGAIAGQEQSLAKLFEIYGDLTIAETIDLGDIHAGLSQFEKALEYYQKEDLKAIKRVLYEKGRILKHQGYEKMSLDKSIEFLEKALKAEATYEVDENIDVFLIDRVIDPYFFNETLNTRVYLALADAYLLKFRASKKKKHLKLAGENFLKAEESGYQFGSVDAAFQYLQSDEKKLWEEAKEILEKRLSKMDAFAACLLGVYYGSDKFTLDLKLSEKYFTLAKEWDQGQIWRTMNISNLIKKGLLEVLQSKEK